MRYKLILIGVAAFASIATGTGTCDSPLGGSPREKTKPLIFRVEKGPSVGLIFGTKHLGARLEHFPEWVAEAVDSSDDVVLETEREGGFIHTAALVARFFHFGGAPLSQSLSKSEWAKLRIKLASVSQDAIDRMSPMGAILTMYSVEHHTSKPGGPSLDDEIRRRARAAGKRIFGLEPLSYQRKMLRATLTLPALKEMLAKGDSTTPEDEYFERGDHQALDAFVEHLRLEDPASWRATFGDRNVAWIPKLEKILARPGRHFIAVGASHLGGCGSVLSLLIERGFAVTRVE